MYRCVDICMHMNVVAKQDKRLTYVPVHHCTQLPSYHLISFTQIPGTVHVVVLHCYCLSSFPVFLLPVL